MTEEKQSEQIGKLPIEFLQEVFKRDPIVEFMVLMNLLFNVAVVLKVYHVL